MTFKDSFSTQTILQSSFLNLYRIAFSDLRKVFNTMNGTEKLIMKKILGIFFSCKRKDEKVDMKLNSQINETIRNFEEDCGVFPFFIIFQGFFAYGKATSDGLVVGRCHSTVMKFGVTGIWKLMNYL